MSLEFKPAAFDIPLETRVQDCCALARQELERGDFDAARRALSDFWVRIGEAVRLEGLSQRSQATLLLIVGIITSRLGSYKQIENAQEVAKDLLSQSSTLFESLGDREGAAESQIYLAVCYTLQTRLDEGRVLLNDVLGKLGASDALTVKGLLWLAVTELNAKNHDAALNVHLRIKPLMPSVETPYLKAVCHGEYARALQTAITNGGREELIDQYLMECTAASYYFEEAGNLRFKYAVENNLGSLLVSVGRYCDALEHLTESHRYFESCKDIGIVARIDENRARAFIGLGRYFEAVRIMKSAVRSLEGSEHAAVVVEVLTTYGIALARINDEAGARTAFLNAVRIAKENDDKEGAGRAWLSFLEELGAISHDEACEGLDEAKTLLRKTQDVIVTRRLLDVAAHLVTHMKVGKGGLQLEGVTEGDSGIPEGFCLADEKKRFEKGWVERAMKIADGHVSKAAKLLGLPKPQRLYQLLKEHDLEHLQKRHHNRSIIEERPATNIRDLHDYMEFTLPPGIGEADVCTYHPITTTALSAYGVEPGDYVLVKLGDVEEGELAGVDVYGDPYRFGTIESRGDALFLIAPDGILPPLPITPETATVEGRVAGYLKGADVKSYTRGVPVTSYPI